ncbi:MFS transporter [Nocardiopsis nanhaiensis]
MDPTTPSAAEEAAQRPRRLRRPALALGVLAAAHFTVSVDFNVVYIALPEIGRELGIAPVSLQWVVSAFSLGLGGFLLLGGRAVDRIGARRMLLLGAVLMGAASVFGALAVQPWVLIAARAVQGLGAAFLFPATLALVNTGFRQGPERNRAMAVWGTAGAFGALAGGALGGLLTSVFGWTSVFWLLVPLTTVIVLVAPQVLPADARTPSVAGFDLPGATLVTGGSLLVVLGISRIQELGWLSWWSTGTVALGFVVLGLLFLVERRAADPLLPLRLLTTRNLIVSVVLVFVVMGVVNALHFVYTTHVQDGLGLSPMAAGLGFLPQGAVAMLGSALLLPLLLNRWGARWTLLVGTLALGLTSVVFALAVAAGSYWAVLPAVVLLGLSAGTLYPAIFAAAGSDVDESEQGVGSAMVSTSQQVGAAVGLVALLAAGGSVSGTSWAGGAAAIAVAFLALALPRR